MCERDKEGKMGRETEKEGDEVPNRIRSNCASKAAMAAGVMDSMGRSDCS